jgi:DNA polymerase-3 subunit gamma/tau
MAEYQSLYRKYRSQTFADLVGQDAASRALQGAIISGRVAHAYLFSGSRGTGKTSAARLLAKALNCTGRPRDSAEPCNQCQSCVEMTAGSALDLIEIDAASNRGIDEIRDLREKVNLAPALGPKKIYIIDEAHMLTEPAFNALLKTLEEPPAHVVFVLCTTDAQKIPLTVIGRCQQFVFRRHSEDQIVARLTHISRAEQVQVDIEAMGLIARTAQGSMRDAVGLLDQLVPLAEGPISLEAARSLLGIADPRLLDTLLDDVLAGRAAETLAELNRVYAEGAELRQVVRGLMEGCRNRLVAAVTAHDNAAARRLSAVLDALLHLDGEVRRHAEPRFLVEATLARLAVELGIEQQGEQEPAPPPALPRRSAPASPQGGEVSGWS